MIDLLTILENKRQHLQEINASISKCLILTRWIKYIESVLFLIRFASHIVDISI